MVKRDKEILKYLEKFKFMSRDQIATIFFSRNKNRISGANLVLKRLRRDGYISADTSRQPYIYTLAGNKFHKNVQHSLAIVDFYIELCRYGSVPYVEVEPLCKPTLSSPDLFVIWRNSPFYIELQLSNVSNKVMENKVMMYERLFNEGEWKKTRPVFGHVWIVSEKEYNLRSDKFMVLQSRNAKELMEKVRKSS